MRKAEEMIANDFNIYDMIVRNVQLHARRDCIVFNQKRLSFAEYRERCDRLAAGLAGAGAAVGDRIAVVAQNSDEFMILYGAAAKTGAVLVPVNWRFQQHEVQYVLNDVSPKLLFAGAEFAPNLRDVGSKVPSIEKMYSIDTEKTIEGFLPFEGLFTAQQGNLQVRAPSESGYVIIHTAAVEGRPRGALLSQANILYCGVQMMNLYGLSVEDAHLCILPLFHIAGLSLAMAVMHAGGKNVILERFDPERTLRLIQEEKATSFFHFPPILKMLIDKYEELDRKFDLSSVRNAAGLDRPENLLGFRKIAPNARFWTAFGQTEAMPVTAGLIEERPGSAGRPTCLSRVRIVDDYDNEVAAGTPGEICVRSPSVFMGYWGREEDTAHTFRNDWHHTGDIGRLDEDGYLWYVKRKAQKELIKPGGENVYPAEVEKVILEHDKVREAVVIGVPDEQWGEAVKAVCVLEPGGEMDSSELIDFVATRIARYKKPKYVAFVDSLPRTAGGGIDRERIKKEHGGKYQ
jgi:long-chain acyl-CoA synthetase